MIQLFIFNNASKAANYGIGTYVEQLAYGLNETGLYRITIVELHANVKDVSIMKDDYGVLHFQIPATSDLIETEAYCHSVFYIIARHIGQSCNKIFFQFNYFQHIHLALLLKAQYPYSRILLTVHYLHWGFELNGNQNLFEQIVEGYYNTKDDTVKRVLTSFNIERSFIRLADEVIVLSGRTKALIKSKYGIHEDKLWLIYNGLKDISSKKEFSSSKKNIVFVGRLDDNKGLEYLLKAFELLHKNYEDISLIIVGDGDFQKYLSKCRNLQGRVCFLGRVEHDEIEEIYANAYIGVIPSFNEQCSYTVIEMMRRGIPVIGTDSTGLAEMFVECPELIVHINELNFVKHDFIAQLSSKIERLCKDDACFSKASRIVRKIYLKNYKLSDMICHINAVISSSLKRTNYIVSSDYLKEMDRIMIQMINMRPDIDVDFFGVSGIGFYMWYRVLSTRKKNKDRQQCALLQENLIYYLDWLYDLSKVTSLPGEIIPLLQEMSNKKFYPSKIKLIITLSSNSLNNINCTITDIDIIKNSLRMCKTKL